MLSLTRSARCGGGALATAGRRMLSLPPHTILPMPALSPTMTQGNLASWKVAVGDEITAGDVVAEIETDKATVDYEVVDDGIIAKILVDEGATDITVGTPLGVIVDDAADVAAFKDFTPSAAAAAEPAPAAAPAAPAATAAPAAATPPPPPPPAAAAAPASGGMVAATPLARQAAVQSGVDLGAVAGSGPGGRVIAADVLEAAARLASGVAPPAAAAQPAAAAVAPAAPLPVAASGAPFVDLPNSQIRKVTAQRMVENKARRSRSASPPSLFASSAQPVSLASLLPPRACPPPRGRRGAHRTTT